MKIGVYLCECGSNISDKVDLDKIKEVISKENDVAYIERIGLMCSYDGVQALEAELLEKKPDRVVIAACSPRDHEKTFMDALSRAGVNPYLMQMVNFREQLAWVHSDIDKATEKAISLLKGAIARVKLHEAMEKQKLELNGDVLIIGAGPAGLKAALTLAEADKQVTVVEKSAMMGGMPVRFEELFPRMECGPCMLEPIEAEIEHGSHAHNIDMMTQSEVVEVKGFYGNYIVKIKQSPRYVDTHKCIGCAECVAACPVSIDNPVNYGLNKKKAMDFTFFGALPNATYIDMENCLRSKGEACEACKTACPIPSAVNFEDTEKIVEKKVGAIILATGSSLYDVSKFPKLGYGKVSEVYTSIEFERILASSGPSGKQIVMKNGKAPTSIAIIHCVGSLDGYHKAYCSGTCCQSAFKYNYEISHKLHGAKVYHFHRELVFPGKDEFGLFNKAMSNEDSKFIRYSNIDLLNIEEKSGKKVLQYKDSTDESGKIEVDMVILMPAMVAGNDAQALSSMLEVGLDKAGFFGELHAIADTAKSKVKGIFLAGTCQSPKDIKESMNQGTAAAGNVLSGLVPGRELEIEPITAEVIETKCAGCRICSTVCPYKAIQFNEEKKKSTVNAVLCQGCGTCVVACPADAIKGNHFTKEEIYAEISGVLS